MARQELGKNVWYDPSVKGYVMVDITESIPKLGPVTVEGTELYPKDEYHISLVNARALAQGDMVQESRIVADVAACLADRAVSLAWGGFTGDFYVCKKLNANNDTETTVIAGVELFGLSALQGALRQRAGIDITSTPHVTLLKSANSPYGIGVNNANDLAEYCTKRDDIAAMLHLSN